MAETLRGEVQMWAGGRWRTVLTAAGIPVDDRRRRGEQPQQREPHLMFVFDGTLDGGGVLLPVFDERFERRQP